MSPSPSDSAPKWRKRKRGDSSALGNRVKKTQRKPLSDDDNNNDDSAAAAAEDDSDSPSAAAADPPVDPRVGEVISDGGGVRISDFPPAVRRSVNRPHPSVLSLVAADRSSAAASGVGDGRRHCSFENVSHGQLQALSAVLPDNPSLWCQALADHDSAPLPAYVCTPPPLIDGKGVARRFINGRPHVLPVHSDWFSGTTVHRLERQVVPHFFSGKSEQHTPEKYVDLRNKIIAKYLDSPERRLMAADCRSLVAGPSEAPDLIRVIRFLDHWGIINYMAMPHHGNKMATGVGGRPILREEPNGELNFQAGALRAIDSLIQFQRPRCRLKMEDVSVAAPSPALGSLDLDGKIREQMCKSACNNCTKLLPGLHYQSLKEAETALCFDCFLDGKYVIGHSSLDFVRVDFSKDMFDPDVDSWSDQETLLLLEAVEKYQDNWNDIAEHVGSKSKAQCILHFIRLPMEDDLLENIEFPSNSVSSYALEREDHGSPFVYSNGNSTDPMQDPDSGSRLLFANSGNPLMALVAFLATAVGPRVAAACAHASLASLSEVDHQSGPGGSALPVRGSVHGDRRSSDGTHGETASVGNTDEILEDGLPGKNSAGSMSPERVKAATMVGLSTAAMKAKLLADQEEREIQKLAASVINNQLKRLELKLKQFAEVETMLLKECEQVDRTRQRFSADRARVMSTRFTPSGAPALQQASSHTPSSGIRQPVVPTSGGQGNISNISNISAANGQPSQIHPQMPFMSRQPMYHFGPRLPLSAIHPSPPTGPSGGAPIYGSGLSNIPTHNHPLLRPSGANNTNIG
ncbi:SWI/SNF complex subunit SWI3C [Acorus calamus]|uniref:SWI/SNF complex subunit SWI3C n=1 Tax=Acorus calamus TaxID=4465 RepID=A0AAV9EB98_ACOCL|nr:SWI/SNF complex subunit SWI3C [Acorus calamus]